MTTLPGAAESELRAPIDTVVLDVDGTLVDSNYHHTLAWARAFAASGYDVPLWRIHRSIGMGGDRLVQRLIGEEAAHEVGAEVSAAWEEEFERLLPEILPLPHARDLLQRLGERPVRVVLASSGKPEHTRTFIELLGAEEHLDDVATGDGDTASKPAPDLVEKAVAEAGGGSPMVVGDSVWDAEAATRAGALMVGLLTGGSGAGELEAAGADTVCENIAALLEVLDDVLAGRPPQENVGSTSRP
ncbi:MAG: HAD family hydrolase [Marmoricola sp.]